MSVAQAVSRIDTSNACGCSGHIDAIEATRELTRLERTVVAIGVADAAQGKRIVANPGALMQRLIRLVAGWRTPAMLADPRLEALRHFAQVAATGGERIADFRRVRDAGFSVAQVVTAALLSRAQALPG